MEENNVMNEVTEVVAENANEVVAKSNSDTGKIVLVTALTGLVGAGIFVGVRAIIKHVKNKKKVEEDFEDFEEAKGYDEQVAEIHGERASNE